MNPIIIRNPVEKDKFQIIKLLRPDLANKSNSELVNGKYFKQWEKGFQEALISETIKIFIAESEEWIIGITTIYLLRRLELIDYQALIEDVYVKESERSKGVGTLIFNHVINYLKERGDVEFLNLVTGKNNLKALRFYEKLGFKNDSLGMSLDLKMLQK